jgi:hypothetical protein
MGDIFYHASNHRLEIGNAFRNGERLIPDSQDRQVEDILEKFRGGRSVSRLNAFFVTKNESDCAIYLKNQGYMGSILIYKVRLLASCYHPMVLVDRIKMHLGNDEILKQIAEGYWHPSQDWKYFEFLSDSMEILEEVAVPNNDMLSGAKFRYGSDRDLAQRIWPRPRT